MDLKSLLRKIQENGEFHNIAVNSPNTANILGNTPLHVAAIWGDLEAIEILVRAGAELDAQGEHGYTPLHEAVEQNKYDAVKLLLQLGASVSIKNDHDMLAAEICGSKDESRSEIASLFNPT